MDSNVSKQGSHSTSRRQEKVPNISSRNTPHSGNSPSCEATGLTTSSSDESVQPSKFVPPHNPAILADFFERLGRPRDSNNVFQNMEPGKELSLEKRRGEMYYVKNGLVQINFNLKLEPREPIPDLKVKERSVFIDELGPGGFFGELELDYKDTNAHESIKGEVKILDPATEVWAFGPDVVDQIKNVPQYLREIIEQMKKRYDTLTHVYQIQSIAHNDPKETAAKLAAIFMLFFAGKIPCITSDEEPIGTDGYPIPMLPKGPIAHFLIREEVLAQWMGMKFDYTKNRSRLDFYENDKFEINSENDATAEKENRKQYDIGAFIDKYQLGDDSCGNLKKQFNWCYEAESYVDRHFKRDEIKRRPEVPCPRLLYLRDKINVREIGQSNPFPEKLFRYFSHFLLKDLGVNSSQEVFSTNFKLGTLRGPKYRTGKLKTAYSYLEVLLTDPYKLQCWASHVSNTDWEILRIRLPQQRIDSDAQLASYFDEYYRLLDNK